MTAPWEYIGYADENGSVRCYDCARAHPEEGWTKAERIRGLERDDFESGPVCGICGEDL